MSPFLLAFFVSVAPVRAAPIELQVCRIEMQWPLVDEPSAGVPLTQGVEVRFVNRTQKIASEVDLRVTYAYRTETIADRGRFSPGVRIDAVFDNFAGTNFFREEPDACAIVRVKFADGTVWTS